jgi:hypothetical protein
MDSNQKQALLTRIFILAALVLLVASYFSPIWWVSLTAPNYPKEAFPDGIRIHFHFNGVFNGCKPVAGGRLAEETVAELGERGADVVTPGKKEVGLDCVHEMNTINHYVGMYPIESGAPVERNLSKFFYGFFGVMLLGFLPMRRKVQVAILGAGFAALTVWMVVELYGMGGAAAIVEQYKSTVGYYFNEPELIARWAAVLQKALAIVVGGLIVAMAVVVAGVWKFPRFSLVLPLVPALLPVFFVIDYSAWLWFFGHNLNPWGAFTVKPFMPTVFGEGKVAQFSTYSYPHYGFGILVAISVLLLLALLLRRRQMAGEGTQ